MIKIEDFNSQQVVFWAMDLTTWPLKQCDDGWMLMLRALGTQQATILGAFDDELRFVGATSYRLSHDDIWLKRINTGVLFKRRGIGTALVEEIRRRHPYSHHWCKSLPGANAFCDSMGMIRERFLEDGRWVYQDRKSKGLTPPC